MEQPQVWTHAAVNGVVVPYLFQGDQNSRLGQAALELSKITYLSFFQSLLKYRNVGAVLIGEPPANMPRNERLGADEQVMAKLLGQQTGATSELDDGGGIVMLSGLLFTESERIYVQSDVRFQHRPRDRRL